VHLSEIEITGDKTYDFSTGASVQHISLARLKQQKNISLASILDQESHVIINSYGSGGLANTSIRGGGSSHTAVVWNGFNIQSPMNGGVDMSLLSAGIADDISVQYGGASALHGSGAVGGAVHLSNSVIYNKKISAQLISNIGSFGTFGQNISLAYGTSAFATKSSFYHIKSENNYTYKNFNKFGHPIEKASNASYWMLGFTNSTGIKTSKQSELTCNIWGQRSYNETMPVMSNETPSKNPPTNDIAMFYSCLKWIHKTKRNTFYANSGYFYHDLTYKNPNMDIVSEMPTIKYIVEVSNSYSFAKKNTLNVTINKSLDIATTKNYKNTARRNATSVLLSNKTKFKKIRLSILESLRYELYDDTISPCIYSFGIEKKLFRHIIFKATGSRNFRMPTFNELYWDGDGGKGNLDLLPEEGYSSDATLSFNKFSDTKSFTSQASIFFSDIDNWIIWSTDSLITPNNINKVRSHGLENRNKVYIRFNEKTTLRINVLYSYTVAQNNDKKSEHYKNQIIYISKHNASNSNSISFNNVSFAIQNSFTSKRYASADNKEGNNALEAYAITNVSIGYTYNIKTFSIHTTFSANNIFNTNYQIMKGYAMPWRNYNLTLSLTIH